MQAQNKRYRIISMMSGTSLDGVDLSCCLFTKNQHLESKSKWTFQLQHAHTFPYAQDIISAINRMQQTNTSFLDFRKLEIIYTEFVASLILQFIKQNAITQINYLSLHGHTIFHRPHQKITVQATNLAYIAAITHLNVIGNFRQLDVLRGGQGAPLAPYAQQIFEGEVFLNLGGIANIGFKGKGYDINYCNLIFNDYARKIAGLDFDQDGKIGRSGTNSEQILEYLVERWSNQQGTSLQRQKAELLLSELNNNFSHLKAQDKIATYYHFLAKQIVQAVKQVTQSKSQKTKIVCTGGGTKNDFLLELLNQQCPYHRFIRPDSQLIDFKEAILFGFLGVKFIQNMGNCGSGIGGMLVKGQHPII